jgi:hypothetical protein
MASTMRLVLWQGIKRAVAAVRGTLNAIARSVQWLREWTKLRPTETKVLLVLLATYWWMNYGPDLPPDWLASDWRVASGES